ncbi:SDR family NAD(P)-dependent oxidoreductase [Flavobacterium salmonis]|uniref:Short chain dehydrogenase n=1 Tax=Flavobacterium salmonis TaxID=2654844 RepID=A0A6V6YSI4_9FLAO|nr:SDR family NAD(P)-dependent oxidoreductase [Flavobacterium salmonis]CAD0002403.1 hypothetical protein FLAT13_01109 [Flavobacterium salmonis]
MTSAKDIGFETAKQLAQHNIKVSLGARNEPEGKNAEATLRDLSLDVIYIKLDITDSEDIAKVKSYIALIIKFINKFNFDVSQMLNFFKTPSMFLKFFKSSSVIFYSCFLRIVALC